MDPLDLISTDPAICHGQACIAGTRIMVSIVLDCFSVGQGEAEILEGYPSLTVEGVRAAAVCGSTLPREGRSGG